MTNNYGMDFIVDNGVRPKPGDMLLCMLCRKPYVVLPYIGVLDQICNSCAKDYGDYATLACQRCHATIARVKPGPIKNGYYVRPRVRLHVDACNVCRPGLPFSTIIEIAQWEKVMKPRQIIVPTSKYANPRP